MVVSLNKPNNSISKLLGVQISCELTNVTNLSPSCDDFRWYLKEKTPIQDSRGDANLVIRCKFCKRVSNADIIPGSILPYSLDDSGHFKTIAKFDCRGLEFTEFSPRCGWSASSVNSDAVFDDISLTDEVKQYSAINIIFSSNTNENDPNYLL
ncbi:unnamed protein product [Schistosoma curassoni]|uniref:Uncharacterized protein n=1 Tax=Schistosoma curassoni TaxID=6186 RepID=A0A183K885_9TREM|nr:unnamed protein product [Schistosoma curassoni]